MRPYWLVIRPGPIQQPHDQCGPSLWRVASVPRVSQDLAVDVDGSDLAGVLSMKVGDGVIALVPEDRDRDPVEEADPRPHAGASSSAGAPASASRNARATRPAPASSAPGARRAGVFRVPDRAARPVDAEHMTRRGTERAHTPNSTPVSGHIGDMNAPPPASCPTRNPAGAGLSLRARRDSNSRPSVP